MRFRLVSAFVVAAMLSGGAATRVDAADDPGKETLKLYEAVGVNAPVIVEKLGAADLAGLEQSRRMLDRAVIAWSKKSRAAPADYEPFIPCKTAANFLQDFAWDASRFLKDGGGGRDRLDMDAASFREWLGRCEEALGREKTF